MTSSNRRVGSNGGDDHRLSKTKMKIVRVGSASQSYRRKESHCQELQGLSMQRAATHNQWLRTEKGHFYCVLY
ncbi:hypothetical protein LWI29_028382 [Acer saccharum]|uniref:Uncharacterized protein n=1 Tax=Acer saccharum TaxID=4024 RepID=A0AA39SER1_ACESA|nr:hypothetical protein LWI29_028382 [Acer saccharum]